MALSLILGEAKLAEQMDTAAEVTLEQVDGGYAITAVHLTLKAKIPGADQPTFEKLAATARPVVQFPSFSRPTFPSTRSCWDELPGELAWPYSRKRVTFQRLEQRSMPRARRGWLLEGPRLATAEKARRRLRAPLWPAMMMTVAIQTGRSALCGRDRGHGPCRGPNCGRVTRRRPPPQPP